MHCESAYLSGDELVPQWWERICLRLYTRDGTGENFVSVLIQVHVDLRDGTVIIYTVHVPPPLHNISTPTKYY